MNNHDDLVIYRAGQREDRNDCLTAYRRAAGAALMIICSWALMLAVIWGAVVVAGRWPSATMGVVFGAGMLGGTWMLARSFWRGNAGSKFWGAWIFFLACVLVVVNVAGVGR